MFYLLTYVMAHPFEAELYGHDVRVEFQEQSIRINYRLEVPFDVVQAELTKLVAENRETSMDKLRLKYLNEKYEGIEAALSLQVDGVDTNWAKAKRVSDKLKKEDRFLIFSFQASTPLSKGAHQISILNRNAENKLSMYRTQIEYGGGVWIDDTDLETPKQWSKEESMKELRMSVRLFPVWWSDAEQLWFSIVHEQERMSYSIQEDSLKSRFLRGRLWLHEALLFVSGFSFISILFPGTKKRLKIGLVFGSMGMGVLLGTMYDARVVIITIIGLLTHRTPIVIGVLLLSVGLPWWCGLYGLLSLLRNKQTSYTWLIGVGLSLAFFFMLN